MKVYVDELPKDCIDCPCESEYYCNLLNEDVGCCKWGEIHKNWPLQSLTDYTKQVRKEVCEKIKSLGEPLPYKQGNEPYMWIIGQKDLDNILEEYK